MVSTYEVWLVCINYQMLTNIIFKKQNKLTYNLGDT